MGTNVLFTPIMLGKVEVRNRVALAPMGTGAYNVDGTVTKWTIPYVEARAKGGVGLIISQFTAASRFQNFPLMRAHEDRLMPSLKQYADAAHKYGAKVFFQIATMGGADLLGSYAPSAIDLPWYSVLPRELAKEQIAQLIEDFAQTAVRTRKVGVDGVELHGAYGYVIAEFISPYSNKRSDEYGGDFEGRMRVPVEIVRRIQRLCGRDYAVGFKFNAHEDVVGGIDLKLGVKIANRMVDEGIVYVHPVPMASSLAELGLSEYPAMPILYHPEDVTMRLTEFVKRGVEDVPVIAAGGIVSPAVAESMIAQGKADMVALGRALLANASWVNDAMAGTRLRKCIRCNICHYEAVSQARKIVCTVNPYLAREEEESLRPAEKRRRVLVVGGGPAGMVTAVTASRRGHDVTLYEKKKELGGLLIPGSQPPFKSDVRGLLQYLRDEVADSNVKVKLGDEVNAPKVRDLSPEVLVVAVGATPITPPIKGLEENRTMFVDEALLDPQRVGKTAIIVGGGVTGCEAALWLAQQGRDVTIVEKLSELMPLEQIGYKYNTAVLAKMLKDARVRPRLSSEVVQVTASTASVKFGDMTVELPADTIILSVGLKTDERLVDTLRASCKESYAVGDSVSPRRIFEAIHDGDAVGRAI